ncbi:MAG: hypothetical protein Tsb0014_13720 [Pleurocapsa sp.]
MEVKHNLENRVIEKVHQLSTEQILQVEKFIDSLQEDSLDSQLLFASAKMSEPVFEKVWDNSEDSDYDNL